MTNNESSILDFLNGKFIIFLIDSALYKSNELNDVIRNYTKNLDTINFVGLYEKVCIIKILNL